MNKSDLVSAIADSSGLSKADAARALDAATGAISGELAKGRSVAITGFGSFLVRARAARSGRNPQTGADNWMKDETTPVVAEQIVKHNSHYPSHIMLPVISSS